MNTTTNWSNLDLKNKSIIELANLRKVSYYRYPGPNEHMLLLLFAGFAFILFGLVLTGHLKGDIPLSTSSLLTETISLILASGFTIWWVYARKKSIQRWHEMEDIREQINTEFRIRDEKIKQYEK